MELSLSTYDSGDALVTINAGAGDPDVYAAPDHGELILVFELILGGVLTATLVPLFVKYFEARDDDASSAIFTVAMVALAAVTV